MKICAIKCLNVTIRNDLKPLMYELCAIQCANNLPNMSDLYTTKINNF